MIVINKRRIQIIIFSLFIGILAFTLQVKNNENSENVENVLSTTSTPVSGKTIIIDAGHGTPDEGAESSSRNDRGGD